MSEEKRSGAELEDDPQIGLMDVQPFNNDTPFNQAMSALTTVGDKELELMCRTTREVADACTVGYCMLARFRSVYIRGRIEQIERLTVSFQGKGRSEVVESLKAGSGVSDGFYEAQAGNNVGFTED